MTLGSLISASETSRRPRGLRIDIVQGWERLYPSAEEMASQ